tara:strand:+ start:1644 stop:2105 length:462 start_codon:yes stop_codon:yes gene_type:complete
MDTINTQMNTLVETQAEEIKKLKEENEKLKSGIDDLFDDMRIASTTMEDRNGEIKKLKDEIEELETSNHKDIQDAYQCHYDTWKAGQENTTITELKEENQGLEEKCGDLREEIELYEERISRMNAIVKEAFLKNQADLAVFIKLKDEIEELKK